MICHFRHLHECACGPDECRVTRPIIVLDERLAAASQSFHRATIAALTVSIASAFILAALAWEVAERRVATVMQEEATWQE